MANAPRLNFTDLSCFPQKNDTMLPVIEKLLIVQDRDTKLRALHKDLERVPVEEQNCRDRMSDDEKKVAAAKAALQLVEVAIKNLELDIGTRRQCITRMKTQQYETRKNEEYTALGHEIVRYEKEISQFEDQEIDLLDKAETAKKALNEADARRKSTQILVNEDLAKLAERKTNVESQIAEISAERAALASVVEPEVLDAYDRISQRKGEAVVALEDGQCKGCHMKVVKSTVVEAKAEKILAHCENCGRLIYYAG